MIFIEQNLIKDVIYMNIVICDDSKSDALAAKEVIKQTLNELHIVAEFDYYSNASDIERKLIIKKEPLDILILDIDMPEVSGLELAEKLRSNNLNLIIIFLSNHEEYVFKAIEFQPFRYIRKIKLKSEMPLAIRAAAKNIELQKDKQIVLNTDDGEIRVMISEIMYFDTEKRKVAIYLKNNSKFLVNRKISEILEIINNDNFVMINRGCVINSKYVKKISNEIITIDDGQKFIISRPRSKEVRKKILKFLGELI